MKRKKIFVFGTAFILLSFLTPTSQAHFLWEKIPVYNCLFGFFGAIVLIIASKFLGKSLIQRDEDYYD